MTYLFEINREQYVKLFRAWKDDTDEDGYDFPYMEMWARYRLNGEMRCMGPYETPATLIFKDDQAAVEFKLRWL